MVWDVGFAWYRAISAASQAPYGGPSSMQMAVIALLSKPPAIAEDSPEARFDFPPPTVV